MHKKYASPGYAGRLAIMLLLGSAASVAGCGSNAEKSVSGRVELIDRVSAALSATGVMAIKGTYGAGCTSRTGAFTIALNGYVLVSPETPLTVVLADTGCVLSVTEVKAGPVAAPLSYTPAAPILLSATYATGGAAFLLGGTGPTQFYANFRLQPDLQFAVDFVLQMVYSDNLSETDLNTNSGFIVNMATATAGVVPSPNATMTVTGLVIRVDAGNIVKSATGTGVLTQGTVVAQTYVIDLGTLGASPTYATVDAAYRSNTAIALSGPPKSIAAADFSLVGLNLTTSKVRTVIVANTLSGVTSYQIFQITVNHP